MSLICEPEEIVISLNKTINPTPKQREFLKVADEHKYILYGGAAGGGKSYILRWWLLRELVHIYGYYRVPNVKVGLFCEDYPSLKDRQISRILVEFPKELGQLRNTLSEGHVFKLNPEWGSGSILLRNLDDASKYNSVEFAAIGVDELTRNHIGIFDELRKRLRWPGLPDDYNFPFAAGSNPGGPGHNWVKKLWIERDFPPELRTVEDEFAFVQAKAQDNPYNPASYYAHLQTLPEDLRLAYAEGDWDRFEGQVFPELHDKIHNLDNWIDPFNQGELVKACKLVAGMDYGSTGYTTCGEVGNDAAENLFSLSEYYQPDRLVSEHSVDIRAMLNEYGQKGLRAKDDRHYPLGQEYILIDPSTEAKTQQGVNELFSIQDEFRRNGIPTQAAHRALIEVGINLIKEYLKVSDLHRHPFTGQLGSPRLFISKKRCPNLWREMLGLKREINPNTQKVEYAGEDHAVDWLRYIIMSRPKAPALVKKDVVMLPPIDQLRIRAEQKFAKKWAGKEHSNQWGF